MAKKKKRTQKTKLVRLIKVGDEVYRVGIRPSCLRAMKAGKKRRCKAHVSKGR